MFCEALGIKIVSLFIRIDIRISQTPLLICPQQSRQPSRVKYPCYVYIVITFDQQIFHSFFVCVILIPRDINNTSKAFCFASLPWRHNGHDGVSNHQPRHCLFNRLFRRRSKKTSKLRVTGLCAGNSPVTGEFPAQIASNRKFFHLMTSSWWSPIQNSMIALVFHTITCQQSSQCVSLHLCKTARRMTFAMCEYLGLFWRLHCKGYSDNHTRNRFMLPNVYGLCKSTRHHRIFRCPFWSW